MVVICSCSACSLRPSRRHRHRHAKFLSLRTGFAHLLNGNMDLALAGTLLVGSIPGILTGVG